MSADALKEILRSWKTKERDSLKSCINVPTHNQHTDDVLRALRQQEPWKEQKGAFVKGWVAVSPGVEQRVEAALEGAVYTAEDLEWPPILGDSPSEKGGCSGCFATPRFIFRASPLVALCLRQHLSGSM